MHQKTGKYISINSSSNAVVLKDPSELPVAYNDPRNIVLSELKKDAWKCLMVDPDKNDAMFRSSTINFINTGCGDAGKFNLLQGLKYFTIFISLNLQSSAKGL